MNSLYAFRLASPGHDIQDIALQYGDQVTTFDSIPLLVLRTTEAQARLLRQMRGITSMMLTYAADVRLAAAIDALAGAAQAIADEKLKYPNGNIDLIPGSRPGEDIPSYPFLDMTTDPPRIDFDPDVRLDTRLGFMAAINISLQVGPEVRISRDDPRIIAIEAASRVVPVVFAAGNHGQRADKQETLSAFAELPYVISVGAVDVSNGVRLAARSSVGSPNVPQSGPTVVADGTNVFVPGDSGTSFAAPRVSSVLACMAAFCLTLRYFVQTHRNDPVEGIPVVGRGIIDKGIDKDKVRNQRFPLPALPRAGIDTDALQSVLKRVDKASVYVDVWPTPDRLRQMLIASAQPLSGYHPYQVGHGYISGDSSGRYLEQFSGADFVRLFSAPSDDVSALAQELQGYKLVDTMVLPWLWDVWRRSLVVWACDLEIPDDCRPEQTVTR